MDNLSVIGIDIAKRVFFVVGMNQTSRVVFRDKWYTDEVSKKIVQIPKGCTIAMEACGASHYWGQKFEGLGYKVLLIPAQHVVPFRSGQKNDYNDALATCEASRRPGIHSVAIKSVDQQNIQMLHRVRSDLVQKRIAISNQVHGLLLEYGYRLRKGQKGFREDVLRILSHQDTPCCVRTVLQERYDTYFELKEKTGAYEREMKALCKESPVIQRMLEVPGIGLITASALFAAVGDPKAYKNGRQFAASLGLVPRQNSTGGKPKLGSITKRGNKYLRALLVHGARSVVRVAETKSDRLSLWIMSVRARKGSNVAAVALANKLARILWAIMARNTSYKPLTLT